MTTLSYTGSYSGDVVSTSSTSTTVNEDQLDLALMAEAERDFDAGLGAPADDFFDRLRRERSERATARETTTAGT